MKNQVVKIFARYDALKLRERYLVAAAVLAGLALIAHGFFIDPALKIAQQSGQQISEQQSQLDQIEAQITLLKAPNQTPDEQARAELDALKVQSNDLLEKLHVVESTLVSPEMTASLLQGMVSKKSSLSLLSLTTLPVASLLEKPAASAAQTESTSNGAAPSPAGAAAADNTDALGNAGGARQELSGGLFKHGMEVKLEGSYADLTAYLKNLEQANLKLLWNSMSLSADKHPKLVLTIVVYTLSLDRTWLIV